MGQMAPLTVMPQRLRQRLPLSQGRCALLLVPLLTLQVFQQKAVLL